MSSLSFTKREDGKYESQGDLRLGKDFVVEVNFDSIPEYIGCTIMVFQSLTKTGWDLFYWDELRWGTTWCKTFVNTSDVAYYKIICTCQPISASVGESESGGDDDDVEYFYIENAYNGTNNVKFAVNREYVEGESSYVEPTLKYSLDKSTWIDYTMDDDIELGVGEKVYFKGDNQVFNSGDYNEWTYVSSSDDINVGGWIGYLLSSTYKPITLSELVFLNLFYDEQGSHIVDAGSLDLHSNITLSSWCYSSMFYGCTSLTSAPELPATTLAEGCYGSMFYGCTSLTSAPELPATTLAEGCYGSMFYGCVALTSLPDLPAQEIHGDCYYNMFRGCTGIEMSETEDGQYLTPYRIPSSGTGVITDDSEPLWGFIGDTSGTFTSLMQINTTYYLK